ncbi:hypothetical protein GOBAR_AA38427 [Gossypium barbadense]|uniref:Uncharacterized protein n=1 Tax=Gossypium barbadense TaxID=3634 RepID=A0A2P5VTX8_GOSBA|nr:hypothetical protein GOBAR_AA38427 [Gossypium barbadense]
MLEQVRLVDDVRAIITTALWDRFFTIVEPTYSELTLEFGTTFSVQQVISVHNESCTITFCLSGATGGLTNYDVSHSKATHLSLALRNPQPGYRTPHICNGLLYNSQMYEGRTWMTSSRRDLQSDDPWYKGNSALITSTGHKTSYHASVAMHVNMNDDQGTPFRDQMVIGVSPWRKEAINPVSVQCARKLLNRVERIEKGFVLK